LTDGTGHHPVIGFEGNVMRFEDPAIVDHGSIAAHTFYRCGSGDSTASMPKDWQEAPHDKFGECSAGHGLS
jgi:hypothetical protein